MADAKEHLGFGGQEVDSPDWDDGGRVHNWKNHIGEHTKAIWHSLTHEQRVAIARDASERASAEEWE